LVHDHSLAYNQGIDGALDQQIKAMVKSPLPKRVAEGAHPAA
jgi:hypothetical protein